jgi:DNA-binding CsgD family transcriptional regulator
VEWPLVGREREVRTIAGLLPDRAAGGGVVVSGAAGVGKTRLAVEAARLAVDSGCAVEWLRATRSAASVPLGALGPLLPAPGAGTGPALLARAHRALAERARGRRLVLCVDDGQLLDPASAALVHQLVAGGDAFAVVTLQRDAAVPDALRALWKEDLCAFLELEALTRDEVERLLAAALGAAVDGRSVNALWTLTRGNVLFLRELVRYGVERGLLAEDDGVWRWDGPIAVGTRLSELVAARLEGLGADARAALEVVAAGAPLETVLLEPAEAAALEALEAHELVTVERDGRRRLAGLTHPLHGEVMRARTSATRSEAIRRRLADGVEAHGARRRGDVLRSAVWRLESRAGGSPERFVRAAEQALAALDWALAGRLAEAAVQAGGGFPARLALARALAGAGRAAEAEELLAALEPAAPADVDRMAVVIARARNLFWGLERTHDAEAALAHGARAIADHVLRDELVALRAWLACADGRPLPALAAAEPLVAAPGTAGRARLRAAMVTASALAMRGRVDAAVRTADAAGPLAERHRDELPLLEPQLAGARIHALVVAGRLRDATDAAERLYERRLTDRSHENTAVSAGLLGTAWLLRGQVATALRWFREGAALLRESDPIRFLPSILAGVAQAAAHAGDADAARQAVERMKAARPPGNRFFGCDVELGRAWAAAAEGESSRARALAQEAADVAQAGGQDGFAVRALHDLCRLGDPGAAAPRLAALAGPVEGPFAATAAAHAAARLESDGARLLEAAERFAGLGAPLLAAEAARAAAAAHRDAGRDASARAAARRAAALLAACAGARPPTLSGAVADPLDDLTPREREIALLAARGLSSREIAARLVVSVRTVDNTLLRAYRKLGISRRTQLAGLLAVVPE